MKMRALLLAAGLGTRLRPLTNDWPKCLMPIGDKPLLEYWLEIIWKQGIREALVNLHYLPTVVQEFLDRPKFKYWVKTVHETELLGTAGTLKSNLNYFKDSSVFMIHADNWCNCNFSEFIKYHKTMRPCSTDMTMMTFKTDKPELCGTVKTNSQGIVEEFYEKKQNSNFTIANAAVYILEPNILKWIESKNNINDFSNDVIPNYIGKIATWHNHKIHRDIGTLEELINAQNDPKPFSLLNEKDEWREKFLKKPIHQHIKNYATNR